MCPKPLVLEWSLRANPLNLEDESSPPKFGGMGLQGHPAQTGLCKFGWVWSSLKLTLFHRRGRGEEALICVATRFCGHLGFSDSLNGLVCVCTSQYLNRETQTTLSDQVQPNFEPISAGS